MLIYQQKVGERSDGLVGGADQSEHVRAEPAEGQRADGGEPGALLGINDYVV